MTNTRINTNTTRSGHYLGGVVLVALLLVVMAGSAWAEALSLGIGDVRQKAVQFNRSYLSALEEIQKASSEVVSARAGALPTISLTGNYRRNFRIPKAFYVVDEETVELQFGFKNNFGATLSLQQSLFQGGKVFTAYSIAKDYRKYTQAQADAARADVIYNAELLFYWAILGQSQLTVLQKALEANQYNLEVVEKQYSQGMVSEFEVLRARVERNNLQPRILAARSNVGLAQKRLKSFIGIDLSAAIELIDEISDTSMAWLPSRSVLIETALSQRPEMQVGHLMVDMRRKAISVAKGDFYPSAAAFASYDWQSSSDRFTMSTNNSQSLTAGISLTIPIFNGGARFGEVSKSKADYQQAQLSMTQLEDDIRLEVEEAYDLLMQAKTSLDIQGTNIAEAEEGLRIANVRYESGVGTLLEVLSAQVALTDARNALAEAVYQFRTAAAKLEKATTLGN